MKGQLFPGDLRGREAEILHELLLEVRPEEFELYQEKAQAHLRELIEAAGEEEILCVRLARRIVDVILLLDDGWDRFREDEKRLLCAAILYFSRSFDEISDFDPEIGLDDDIEVMNSCLRAAGRADLCIIADAF